MSRKLEFGRFWRELRRRHVVRAGGVYAVSAFVVLQLGEIVLPAFNTPDWALQSLVVAAFLGLPVVLAVAWAYDLTSAGLRRTRHDGRSERSSAAPRWALLGVTTVSVAFAGFWFSRSFMGNARGEPLGGDGAAGESGSGAVSAGTPVFASYDPSAPITAVAVLPLANFAQGDDLFARQLHDEIITQLSGATGFRVASRTAVVRYADTTLPLPRVADELRVQAVVTGSVAMTDESDSVRISIQLVHAPSDTHLLTRTFQREMKDVLRLQTEVANEIARAVQGEVEEAESETATQVAHVPPVDVEAHRAFLEGWEDLDLPAPNLEGAMGHFSAAVEADPEFAGAWVGLAETGLLMLTDSLPETAPDELVRRVEESARRAEALGGDVAAIRLLLSEARGEAPRSESDSLARAWVREFTEIGRRAVRSLAARTASGRAADSARIDLRLFTARYFINEGRYDSAAAALQEVLEADPADRGAWRALEDMYVLLEDFPRALEVRAERVAAETGQEVQSVATEFDSDDPAVYWSVRRRDNRARQAWGAPVSHMELAATALGLGERDEAVRQLGLAVEQREPSLGALKNSPIWDPLRDDPEFRRIAARARDLWRSGGWRGTPGRPGRPGNR